MYEWLMSISAGGIILFFLECLLGESGVKKTVRFAFGLVFMVVVLAPLLGWLGGETP